MAVNRRKGNGQGGLNPKGPHNVMMTRLRRANFSINAREKRLAKISNMLLKKEAVDGEKMANAALKEIEKPAPNLKLIKKTTAFIAEEIVLLQSFVSEAEKLMKAKERTGVLTTQEANTLEVIWKNMQRVLKIEQAIMKKIDNGLRAKDIIIN